MPREPSQPYSYELEAREDHLMVRQRGMLSIEFAPQLQRLVEEEMARSGLRWAIFDNRETDRPDEMVRALMWTWLGAQTQIERLALLLAKERNTQRARETADRNRVRMSAFSDEQEAIDWLRS